VRAMAGAGGQARATDGAVGVSGGPGRGGVCLARARWWLRLVAGYGGSGAPGFLAQLPV